MPTHCHVIDPEHSLTEAVSTMREKKVSCLPVVQGEVPVGILTERDLVRIMHKTKHNPTDYLVQDVMSSRVITVNEDQDLFDMYSQMRGNRIRHLIITNERSGIVGVKTFTDIMVSLGREHLAEIKTVADVMTRNMRAMRPDDRVYAALAMMIEHNISCVPVLENDRAVGILTERDLCGLATDAQETMGCPVSKVMSAPVHTINKNFYAFDAVTLMNDLGIRRLIVIDDQDRVLGLITQTDMVATLIKRHANLEFMVRKRTRQLLRKSEELEFSNQQLRHLDEVKSAFLSSVSHELRTPLTSLLGFAKITGKSFSRHFVPLTRDDAGLLNQANKILGNLDILVHEGERMTRLINDFLDLTKIEAGRVDWNDRLVQASEFVLHASHSLRAQFETNKDVDLQIMVQDGLPSMYVDMDRMLQVMINLLSNAAKFTRKGRVVVEAVNVDNDFVEARVTDTGPGIQPKDSMKIFDKFHQLEKHYHSEEIKGTGLGLAICKEIVEHYNGRIWVESELGKGSTFKFRIPAAEAAALEPQKPVQPRRPATAAQDAPLIMAVDDNPAIRLYLEQLFTDEGFRVITVPDGKQALKKAEEMLPQCILMDLMMPGLDGGEAIRRIRENPVTQDIPIAVLSAYPSRRIQEGDASISKPVDEDLLIQTVRGLIHGGRIQGRKCIIVPNIKPEANMLMISAGKLRYFKPEEIRENISDQFAGTVFLPGSSVSDPGIISAISNINDVLVMITPEGQGGHEQGTP